MVSSLPGNRPLHLRELTPTSNSTPGDMFPKLATNLLHTNLSRVAFTQTQAAQFRTVLQFQPSYPPSPLPPTPLQPNSLLASQYSPSNSKSDYSHPGGSKSNPGSKFYAGYTVRTISFFGTGPILVFRRLTIPTGYPGSRQSCNSS